MMNEKVSRRTMLGGAAALAGLGAGLTTTAVPRAARADNAADAAALNAVLRLEFETIAVYDSAIGTAAVAGTEGAFPAALFTHFREQHRDATVRLVAKIVALGATPVTAGTVDAPPTPSGFTRTVSNYLKYAANLERTNAIANAGHNDSIDDADAAALVFAIAGTESQHFAILNLLVRGIMTPGSMAAANINDLVPRSFVALDAEPAASLTSVADFPFGAP